MNLLGSLAIAFSMYSAIPVPQFEWTRDRMKYAMCFFPLVGVAIGAAQILVYAAAARFSLPGFALLLPVVVPIIVTGGIHMDGFLDVTDARASHREREEKLRILKDPHTGAFAVIGCGCYLLLYLAGVWELAPDMAVPYAAVFVLTRALSGLSVVLFPKAKNSGLAAAFSEQAQVRAVVASMAACLVISVCWIFYFGGFTAGIGCMAVSAAVYGYYYWMSRKEFGGITGDLAGYFLQVCELALLLALAVLS